MAYTPALDLTTLFEVIFSTKGPRLSPPPPRDRNSVLVPIEFQLLGVAHRVPQTPSLWNSTTRPPYFAQFRSPHSPVY